MKKFRRRIRKRQTMKRVRPQVTEILSRLDGKKEQVAVNLGLMVAEAETLVCQKSYEAFFYFKRVAGGMELLRGKFGNLLKRFPQVLCCTSLYLWLKDKDKRG
jgi:hypothetical protein